MIDDGRTEGLPSLFGIIFLRVAPVSRPDAEAARARPPLTRAAVEFLPAAGTQMARISGIPRRIGDKTTRAEPAESTNKVALADRSILNV